MPCGCGGGGFIPPRVRPAFVPTPFLAPSVTSSICTGVGCIRTLPTSCCCQPSCGCGKCCNPARENCFSPCCSKVKKPICKCTTCAPPPLSCCPPPPRAPCCCEKKKKKKCRCRCSPCCCEKKKKKKCRCGCSPCCCAKRKKCACGCEKKEKETDDLFDDASVSE